MKCIEFVAFLTALAVSTVPVCHGERIVVLYPCGSKSHLIAVMPIVEELDQIGHNITLVTAFKVPLSNSINEIFLTDVNALIEPSPFNWFELSAQGKNKINK